MKKFNGARILVLDVETSPIISYTWGLFDQNVALNQIKQDWNLLSYACKWLGEPKSKVMYADQRNAKNVHDDKDLLLGVWELLDQADVVLTQNGKKFDTKKLNARFLINGMKPPSSYKQIDTLVIAKRMFSLTSNKLEYMTNKLCTKYKKLKTKKFQGFDLWSECLKGNLSAWNEMKKYNIYDILSLEELYTKLRAWNNDGINFNLYSDSLEMICSCGSKSFRNKGFTYTASGKYTRHRCNKCGSEIRGNTNLFEKDKRKSLMKGTVR